jgi:hypothetical protein
VAYHVCRQVAARVLTFMSLTGLKKSWYADLPSSRPNSFVEICS